MKPITCLLIDDDEDEHEFFKMSIGEIQEPYEYRFIGSSVDAMKVFRSDSLEVSDYIFLDLNMPNVNGRECLQEIKKIEKLQNTKIIMYSTSSSEKDISDTRKLGANHYIVKPLKIADMVTIFSALFKRTNIPFLLNRLYRV